MNDRTVPGAILVRAFQLGSGTLRVCIKDCIDIAGYPTEAGSRALANSAPAARHAAVVQSLLDGGCLIIGKANMHELAYGVTGINHWTGTPPNPQFPQFVPGGSSSGSAAAVAAGLVDFAIGTDTGGSIRIPAACCGVYGLKPTYGSVSRDGVQPAHSSLDCVGPLARDLATIERAMTLLTARFRPEPAPDTVRVGVLDIGVDPIAHAAVGRALSSSAIARIPASLPLLQEAFLAGLTVIGAENWRAFGHLTRSPGLGDDVRGRLLAAADITHAQVQAAERLRSAFSREVDACLEHVDVLALPTLPAAPPTLAEAAADWRKALPMTQLVRPFNLSGHPALSIPLAGAGVPTGLQLVGRKDQDARLCAVAHRILRGPSAPATLAQGSAS
jgi:amidase